MKLSKKIIVDAVKAKTGLEDVGLTKYDGEYYWTGKAAAIFSGSSTHFRTLNHPNVNLERWVEDFESKVKEAEEFTDKTIQEQIDAIDWNVEYEQ